MVFEYCAEVCKTQLVTTGRLLAVLDMRPSTTIKGASSYGSFNLYTIIGTILDPKLNKRIKQNMSDDLVTQLWCQRVSSDVDHSS